MEHRNNFGLLRLVFASLVILSHSAELLDGTRAREPLTQLFHTLSFGELAVDGFFLVSGYLVTQSFVHSHSLFEYFAKRLLRIYPGYLVAFLVCLFIVAPLAGGQLDKMAAADWAELFARAILLLPPQVPEAFAKLPVPQLNVSMWTIAYELRCYVLVALLGVLGLLRQRRVVVGLALGLVLVNALHLQLTAPRALGILLGGPDLSIRMSGVFLCGSCFFLFRDMISYRWSAAAAAAVALTVLMRSPTCAELALATLGGYIIFCFAFKLRSARLNAVGQRTDISYGLYLYAFPLANLLILKVPNIGLWALDFATAASAATAGLLSWLIVEKPALAAKRRLASLSSVRVSEDAAIAPLDS